MTTTQSTSSFDSADDPYDVEHSTDSSETVSETSSESLSVKLGRIGKQADQQVQREIGQLFLDAGDTLRGWANFIFVVVFITALTHGTFIVMLALKLDGNSVFNWNVTLMPLAIFYGLLFIFSVIGFAALPIVTLTAEEYAADVRANISIGWILPELDRRIELERKRLTLELRKALANMVPVRDIARWINAYVETNLVGDEAALKETLSAVQRGDKVLQERLARQDEIIERLVRFAAGGVSDDNKSDAATVDTDVAASDAEAPPVPPKKAAAAAPRSRFSKPIGLASATTSLAAKASLDLLPSHDAFEQKAAAAAQAGETAPASRAARARHAVPRLSVNDEPMFVSSNSASLRRAASADESALPDKSPRSVVLENVSALTETLSRRLSHILVIESPNGAAGVDGENGDGEADEPFVIPGAAQSTTVARHVLRSVKREMRRRAREHKQNGRDARERTPRGSVTALLAAIVSEASASENEAGAELADLMPALEQADAKSLKQVATVLQSYLTEQQELARQARRRKMEEQRESADQAKLMRRTSSRQRRGRSDTKSMGDFLRDMLVGGARELLGDSNGAADDFASRMKRTTSARGADLGRTLERRVRHQSRRLADSAAEGVFEALEDTAAEVLSGADNSDSDGSGSRGDASAAPELLVHAFAARGTAADTAEMAAVRSRVLRSAVSEGLAQVAPELVAVVQDINRGLWGVRNTMHAIDHVLTGAHHLSVFVAQSSAEVASARTPLAAFDRLGRVIRREARRQPAPSSLSMSIEQRAVQRRRFVTAAGNDLLSPALLAARREVMLEEMAARGTDDSSIGEGWTDLSTAAPPSPQLLPRRRMRRQRTRASSPLAFANESPVLLRELTHADDDDDDDDELLFSAHDGDLESIGELQGSAKHHHKSNRRHHHLHHRRHNHSFQQHQRHQRHHHHHHRESESSEENVSTRRKRRQRR